MANTVEVIGGLGEATDSDVLEGVTYTSDNGIKRSGTFSPTAENIIYDNSNSGINGTNLQEVIDEIVESINDCYVSGEQVLITVEDIDAICGATIQYINLDNGVTF